MVAGTRELSSGRSAVHRFQLAVVRGPDRGSTITSSGDEITVGTDPGSDLRLTDTAVSRHHCALSAGASRVLLRDLHSTNGTHIGPLRIWTVEIHQTTLIRVGETELRLELLNEVVSPSLSTEKRFGSVLGSSDAMRRMFAILERVAPSEASILIEGETGTGKGLLAEAIHSRSNHRSGPFVVVDCASIPGTLIESELFGHVRGSFTGANNDRPGLFEEANGGTLFLDEIGELPLDLQPKLLRALETREVRRLGESRSRRVDLRVISATNRDLRSEVNRNSFRADLYYRLNTIRVVVPPLRERREDIPMLTAHFYNQLVPGTAPPMELIKTVRRGDWRGNVRELMAAVERAVVFGDPTTCGSTASESPWEFKTEDSFRQAKLRATAAWERHYLTELIEHHEGNLSRASAAAKMDRTHLRTLLHRHGISIPGRS